MLKVRLPSPLGFTEQIGAHFGPQAFEHQQVDAAGGGKNIYR